MGAHSPATAADAEPTRERVLALLADVADPEIPVLSVLDLGVVRHVQVQSDGAIEVGVTPTYSGCPATPVIKADILKKLQEAGYRATTVDVLSPPWTSDWLSAAGRQKLTDYGIAPPVHAVGSARRLLHGDLPIACPRCGSLETARLSEFGSTPCKALHRCNDCLEPFDYFKCL